VEWTTVDNMSIPWIDVLGFARRWTRTTSLLALIVSSGLKWLIIGRQRREEKEPIPSVLASSSERACDCHYNVGTNVFFMSLPTSREWNVILMLRGLGVDMTSGFSDKHLALSPSVLWTSCL